MRSGLPGAAFLAALLLFVAAEAVAQDVLLSSRDGSVEIEGTLTGYDTETYRIDTRFGPLTVNADAVDCTGPGCPDLGSWVPEIRVAGSPVLGEVLLPALIEAWGWHEGLDVARHVESDHRFRITLRTQAGEDRIRFLFDLSDSRSGIEALRSEAADIALTSHEEEAPDLRASLIALDAVVPVAREAAGDALIAVRAESLPLLPLPEGPGAEAIARALAGLDASAAAALSPPEGLSLTRLSQAGGRRPVALSGSCGRMVPPSRSRIQAADYPLVLPLVVYTANRRMPRDLRDFLSWAARPAGSRVVVRSGFVGLAPERVPVAGQGQRLLDAILAAGGGETGLEELKILSAALRGSARLATTIRFAPGATRPDLASDAQITRLVRALEAGLHDGQELVFAGFSDGQGPAEGNLRISAQRATVVRNLVEARASALDTSRVMLTALGFGEALPLACDDTDWGRRINRRVEVWIRPLQR